MGQILLWCGFFEMVAGVPAMQSMLDGSGRYNFPRPQISAGSSLGLDKLA
jgi:hypothetical protein